VYVVKRLCFSPRLSTPNAHAMTHPYLSPGSLSLFLFLPSDSLVEVYRHHHHQQSP
jgi:hypothetical protein